MLYLSKTIFLYRFYKILVIEPTTEVKAEYRIHDRLMKTYILHVGIQVISFELMRKSSHGI